MPDPSVKIISVNLTNNDWKEPLFEEKLSATTGGTALFQFIVTVAPELSAPSVHLQISGMDLPPLPTPRPLQLPDGQRLYQFERGTLSGDSRTPKKYTYTFHVTPARNGGSGFEASQASSGPLGDQPRLGTGTIEVSGGLTDEEPPER
ncbi:hypothetical protein [Corallococcus sp. EGB]|uniref:hypothetical protein n=1 Tax=Corallococcus sp. EGB TaxID=1521117 RepID=UPI001CBF802B|nr:hypothetical protein [Corallococcus sp. EGB]